jgi:cytochrome c oxidase subunit 3
MPGTHITEEIELIIEDIGGGRGGNPPPPDRRDGGGDEPSRRPAAQPSGRRYQTAIFLGMASILMFFFALAGAFLVRKTGNDWVAVRLPPLVWLNSLVLLASGTAVELARRRLDSGDAGGFRIRWGIATTLGLLFVAGQMIVWRNLAISGVYLAGNPAGSFFYIFTVAHAIHLVGGIAALIYVFFRTGGRNTATSRHATAVQITSYYWHFMDGLWIFLLGLLYFGK